MDMTQEQCEYVRELRCGKITHSWRGVSEAYCDKFDTDNELHGNQMHGIELCEEAAKFFGEDHNLEPWN